MSGPKEYLNTIAISYDLKPDNSYTVYSLHESELNKSFNLVDKSAYDKSISKLKRLIEVVEANKTHHSNSSIGQALTYSKSFLVKVGEL